MKVDKNLLRPVPSFKADVGSRTRWGARLRQSWPAYLMLAPLFLGLIIFGYYPPFSGMYHSFFAWNGTTAPKWIGLSNFYAILRDPIFIHSLKNMLYFLAAGLMIGIVPSFIVAEMIYAIRLPKAKYWYRVLLLVPIVVPGVVILMFWGFIYDPELGMLTAFIHMLGFHHLSPDWLGSPRYAMPSLMFLGFPWIGGTSVLIYLAGLMQIPKEVFEAAQIDGANLLRRIRAIDIPLMKGQFKLFVILGVIGGFQGFNAQLVLTQGGPYYSTDVPGYYMYTTAFVNDQMGKASAVGFLLFIAVLIITILINKYFRAVTY